MIRFFIVFMVIQIGLFGAELLRPVQQAIIIPFTAFLAKVSAFIISLFDDRVLSQGVILRSMDNGFAVSIQAGCNGVEASIVLIAAILAFPSPWRHKLTGIMLGFFAIQLLNLVRIISLFYLGQWNMTAFEWAHLYLWQTLIMLDALIVFLVWIRFLPRGNQVEPGHEAVPA